jgi:hypothetical protein
MMFFTTGGTSFLTNAAAISDAVKKNVTGIREMVESIDKEFSKLAVTIGAGREQAFLLKQTLTEGLTEITRLGGSVANIIEQQTALNNTFGTQLVLNKNATTDLFATTTATGIKVQELSDNYANLGKSIHESNSEMASIMESANLIGVNAQKVAQSVSTNMKELQRFNFKDGVMGLSDMAAKSAVLRVDMATSLKAAKDLYSPEKAQSFVNTLSRLGATGSQELMNVERVRFLARNEPAKLQEEIAKMASKFVDETGKMSAVGMDFLDEISKEAGIGAEDLSKMGISFSQIAEKKELIGKSGFNLAPDSKELEKLNNLLTKGKDGKFEVTYEQDGQQVTKALEDMNSYERTELQKFLEKQNQEITNTFAAKPGEDKNLTKLVEQQMDISTKMSKAVEAIGTIATSQIAGSNRGEEFVKTTSENIDKLSSKTFEKLDSATDRIGEAFDKTIELQTEYAKKTIDTAATGIQKIATSNFDSVTTILSDAFTSTSSPFKIAMDGLIDIFKIKKADDFVSFPGNNRMLTGPEGTFEVNENDTIIAGTDFPKTEEEVNKMMEILKSPQNSFISSPIETKPLLIPENMGIKSAMDSQREKALTEIMMTQMSGKENSTTPKEIKTTNDINHKLDLVVDLKNVPTNMNQNDLKNTLETAIKQPEFLNKLRDGMKSIEGFNFY